MEHRSCQPPILNKKKEMRAFYIALSLRCMATSMIGVFGPVYLLTVGFSLKLVLLYLAINLMAITPSSPIVGKITQKFGLKHTVIAAPPVSILFYLMLYFLKSYPSLPLLFSTAIVGALGATLFWIPMNSHFALNSSHKTITEQVSYRKIISKQAKMTAPLIASAIIVYFGFPVLFTIASLFYVLCFIPLLMTKDYTLPLHRHRDGFLAKKNLKYSLLFFVRGVYSIAGVTFLPLYIYLQSESYVATGISASFVGVGVIIGALIIGKVADRFGKYEIMRLAAIISTGTWIAVFFMSGVWLYILSVIAGMASMALSVTVMAIYCKKFKPVMSEKYMIHREMWLGIGNGVVPLFAIALIGFGFKSIFIIAALTAAFFIFYKF